MKRMTTLLLLCAVAGMFATGSIISSCEKEPVNPQDAYVKPGKTPNTGYATNKGPTPDGIIGGGYACGYIECGTIGPYGPRYNKVTFTPDYLTSTYYSSLRYTIYAYTGTTGTTANYQRIDEFTCSSSMMQYATSLLANATSHYLVVSDPAATAPPINATYTSSAGFSIVGSFQFTTGSYAGVNCPK